MRIYNTLTRAKDELKTIDVNVLTPIESMSILSELSKKAKEL